MRGQEGKGAGKKYIDISLTLRLRCDMENKELCDYIFGSTLVVENLNEDKLYKFPNRKFKGVWWMP